MALIVLRAFNVRKYHIFQNINKYKQAA